MINWYGFKGLGVSKGGMSEIHLVYRITDLQRLLL
jgi:hypothetical protein